jgi:hypothetical protein
MIKVKKSEDKPESTEILAASIVQISDGFAKLLNSGLTKRAISVLLQDGIGAAKISKKDIILVLDNLPRLKGWYVK